MVGCEAWGHKAAAHVCRLQCSACASSHLTHVTLLRLRAPLLNKLLNTVPQETEMASAGLCTPGMRVTLLSLGLPRRSATSHLQWHHQNVPMTIIGSLDPAFKGVKEVGPGDLGARESVWSKEARSNSVQGRGGAERRQEAGGGRLEAGGWRLEAGGWRLEAGGCRGWRAPQAAAATPHLSAHHASLRAASRLCRHSDPHSSSSGVQACCERRGA
eukprot:2722997-Rhodomonas_salina.1